MAALIGPVALAVYAGVVLAMILIIPSIRIIGPTEVGLVLKRFSHKKMSADNPVAFDGEAGFQDDLLMPGWRFKFWVLYQVNKFPWVQVPAGEIGVVIAQVGKPLPIGAKSGVYKKEFGNFSNARKFIENDGQKGVQRPVLTPGTSAPIHPVAFLIITKNKVYGLPVSPDLKRLAEKDGRLTAQAFGLDPRQLELVRIAPQQSKDGDKPIDTIGIVNVGEGDPLPPGDIACRLGGFEDVHKMMDKEGVNDAEIIEVLLGCKNILHNNYQDFQAFLDNGGKIGLQHDPLLYGTYALNPFLVRVEMVPMLVVNQGEVAVIKSYVGLVTEDTSGEGFKFGSLVRPGRRGIWQEPLRTGKYAINPHCYQSEIVPTAILTLNWAEAVSKAHNLDGQLQQITAKSCEGFVFKIDLQVQIHVPDTMAPKVISMVGTMLNLVSEVLQAAVGNHFRDKLQSMPAVRFIETRQSVQIEAFEHIKNKLDDYKVETRGVYIQDVILPEALVEVLTQREIANQEIKTYDMQRSAQEQRITMEQAKGTADMQAQLAKSKVGVDIEMNNAAAKKAQADGESTFIEKTGAAKSAEVRAVGLARAEAYAKQVEALGQGATALVNAIEAVAKGGIKVMPEVLVAGGGGSFDALASVLTQHLRAAAHKAEAQEPAAPAANKAPPPAAAKSESKPA